MATNLSTIARLLEVEDATASQFCERVQRRFSARSPSVAEIARCLQNHPQMQRTPELVAAVIRGDRTRRPRGRELRWDDEEYSFDDWGAYFDQDDTGPLLNIQRHDPRKATEGMAKCPHGVLRTKKCRICDPVGFESEYGEV